MHVIDEDGENDEEIIDISWFLLRKQEIISDNC